MKTIILLLFLSCSIISCSFLENQPKVEENRKVEIYDSHVHLMSPDLIAYWKSLGIPFSRPEANYSNLDTILKNNHTQNIDLIGMGYVYGNPEYYQGDDAKEKMMAENDYLFQVAKPFKKVKPFFAIDPLKEYALEELNRCQKVNPNSGLKLHFSTSQVYLTEPVHLNKVKPIFQKAADYNLTILLHFDNWHPKFGPRDLGILIDSILNELPAINLRIAHFGTSGGFNEKTKRFLEAFLELKNKIPNRHTVKLDISAVALDKDSEGVSKLSNEEFKTLRSFIEKVGMENIIFGSDYPLYSSLEYLNILKNKLNFTQEEIETILH